MLPTVSSNLGRLLFFTVGILLSSSPVFSNEDYFVNLNRQGENRGLQSPRIWYPQGFLPFQVRSAKGQIVFSGELGAEIGIMPPDTRRMTLVVPLIGAAITAAATCLSCTFPSLPSFASGMLCTIIPTGGVITLWGSMYIPSAWFLDDAVERMSFRNQGIRSKLLSILPFLTYFYKNPIPAHLFATRAIRLPDSNSPWHNSWIGIKNITATTNSWGFINNAWLILENGQQISVSELRSPQFEKMEVNTLQAVEFINEPYHDNELPSEGKPETAVCRKFLKQIQNLSSG